MLPEVARKAAEDVATLIIQAGCLVPSTSRPRQPEPLGYGGGRDLAARLEIRIPCAHSEMARPEILGQV